MKPPFFHFLFPLQSVFLCQFPKLLHRVPSAILILLLRTHRSSGDSPKNRDDPERSLKKGDPLWADVLTGDPSSSLEVKVVEGRLRTFTPPDDACLSFSGRC